MLVSGDRVILNEGQSHSNWYDIVNFSDVYQYHYTKVERNW